MYQEIAGKSDDEIMLRVLVYIINANNNNYRELAIKCKERI